MLPIPQLAQDAGLNDPVDYVKASVDTFIGLLLGQTYELPANLGAILYAVCLAGVDDFLAWLNSQSHGEIQGLMDPLKEDWQDHFAVALRGDGPGRIIPNSGRSVIHRVVQLCNSQSAHGTGDN
jgi:hypothetical protein